MASHDSTAVADNSGLLARLRDRERWPRRLWWPTVDPIASTDNLERHHRETSETIRRAMITLIAFCFFCAMSLSQPDGMLFNNATIAVPIGQATVGFTAFMIVAPLTLLGLVAYLHVFLGHARRIEDIPEADRLPTLFNMEGGVGGGVAYFVFYWLPPMVLGGFAWKAALRTNLGLALFLGSLITLGSLLWVQLRRDVTKGDGWKRVLLWVLLASTVTVAVDCLAFWKWDASIVTANLRASRSWDLRGQKLSGMTLRGTNLRDAQLDGADLSGTDLSGAILRGVDLTRTNLQGANLSRADLRGAKVKNTQLDCAFLAEASFAGASFQDTDLAYTIGMSKAMVDEHYRPLVPKMLTTLSEVPEPCREYPRIMLLVEERVKALESIGR